MSDDPLADLWAYHADAAIGDDAPVYRAIAVAVSQDPELLEITRRTPPDAHHPNHLFAAVRFLLLGDVEDDLAEAYLAGDQVQAATLFGRFVRRHADEIVDVLQERRTQTNEVGRVGVIGPALRHVAARHPGGIGLLDVGASGGLNLLVDRIGCDYGDFQTVSDAPVQVATQLHRPIEPFGPQDLRLGWRGGLDRSPIDLADEASARWLMACVWPEQRDRVARLEAAITLAQAQDWSVHKGDAVDALAAAVAEIPAELHAVVLTSWVVFYFDRKQRAAFDAELAALGRPISWVSLEHPGVVDVPTPAPDHAGVDSSAIGLVTFDDGRADRRFLGWAHPHGRWLDWRGQAET